MWLTSDTPWDLSVLDNEYDQDVFYDALSHDDEREARREQRDPRINDHGGLRNYGAYQQLFQAQDDFIEGQQAQGIGIGVPQDTFYEASSAAINVIDPDEVFKTAEPAEPT